jgi:hypothetical protein
VRFLDFDTPSATQSAELRLSPRQTWFRYAPSYRATQPTFGF